MYSARCIRAPSSSALFSKLRGLSQVVPVPTRSYALSPISSSQASAAGALTPAPRTRAYATRTLRASAAASLEAPTMAEVADNPLLTVRRLPPADQATPHLACAFPAAPLAAQPDAVAHSL